MRQTRVLAPLAARIFTALASGQGAKSASQNPLTIASFVYCLCLVAPQ
ncbi:MAG TPA: hypothetical protein VK335_20935 [Bryobacteraceae bacterium]|nr:hypothetical protein [Bryobacteraceae bacterium]